MSERRRHRLRHIANPHCWFRRPASAGEPAAAAGGTRAQPDVAWGLPVDPEREREEQEAYDMALALSLSTKEQSRSLDLESQEQAQLARATQDSMATGGSGAAESLSWSYFTHDCLDWGDAVCDGLYDCWGAFPELLELAAPASGVARAFPSLAELRRIPYTPGDSREVVVVDHASDTGLCTIDERAADAVSAAIKQGAEACAQALARVVVERMGGPASAGELAQRCWEHMQRLKLRRSSLVVPIGEVRVGLARHRALLFKCLADACRLPCKVVRGEHLGEGTSGDRAAVLVRLQDRLHSVDLFSGRLRLLGGAPEPGPPAAAAAPAPAAEPEGLDWHGELDGPALVPLREGGGAPATPDAVAASLRALGTSGELQAARASSRELAASAAARRAACAGRHPPDSGAPPAARPRGERPCGGAPCDSPPCAEAWPQPPGLPQLRPLPEPAAAPSPSSRGSAGAGAAPPAARAQDADCLEWGNTTPFLQAAFQRGGDGGGGSGEEEGLLGGDFEFIDGRVAEAPARGASGPGAAAARAGSGAPAAPSPFADPDVQDAGVPYENLPVDKGHVLAPPEAEPQPSDPPPPPPLPQEPAAREGRGHWKLRALAEVRRHSDSDIFLDSGRRATRERLAERLEALPELREEAPPAPRASTREVPPAQPLAHVQVPRGAGSLELGSDGTPEEWEIRPEELQLGPRIGIGSYGEVFRGVWRFTSVAVKRLIDQDLPDQLMEEFRAEVAIMRRLRHVNILLFLGAVTQPPHLAIVTQFMPRGSLFRLLHRTPSLVLDERRRLHMALDIARGCLHLHSCVPPIVHRDLKTANLLVDRDFTVKVCDFGLSRVRMSTLLSGRSQAGTPEWTAPEVLRSQSYDESSDIYSFGVVLWELLTGEEPWADKTAMQVVGAVGWGDARLRIPAGTHPAMAALISQCFGEPAARPGFADILQALKAAGDQAFVRPLKADDGDRSASAVSEAEP